MTSYIIDPSIVYWIHVLDAIREFCGICSIFLGIGECFILIGWLGTQHEFIEFNDEETSKHVKVFKKWAIIVGIAFLTAVLMSTFIPSVSISTEMLIAKTATFSNVEWTVDQIKGVVDYIVSAIKGV